MGLMDIVNGVLNGPRGQRQPSTREGSGGMSPMMMALLALLAYKALKGRSGSGHASAPAAAGLLPSRPAVLRPRGPRPEGWGTSWEASWEGGPVVPLRAPACRI
jgi:hypothetical protein